MMVLSEKNLEVYNEQVKDIKHEIKLERYYLSELTRFYNTAQSKGNKKELAKLEIEMNQVKDKILHLAELPSKIYERMKRDQDEQETNLS